MNVRLFLSGAVFAMLMLGHAYAKVRLGIDNLEGHRFKDLEGKRVGLVTNPSGVDSRGISTIDLFHRAPNVNLVALFGPEHGVYGDVKAGEYVKSRRDARTGVWVYSLFGPTRKPTQEMLKGIDCMVYDLQDLGCRSYTYISTLGLVMEACAERDIPVMVLDRPNPLGGLRVEGPRLDPRYRSFVGKYNVPYVYGLTVAELARWINRSYLEKPCRLKIYKMGGWKRSMTWEDTGLSWKATSPNIPTFRSAVGYVATGALGDLGIANGANQDYPFELIADEGWDPSEFSRRFNELALPGIKARPFDFFPKSGKWKEVNYCGSRLSIDPKAETNLTAINYRALDLVRKLYPRRNYFKRPEEKIRMFDKISGSPVWRESWTRGATADELERRWEQGVEAWRKERRPFLLY